MPDLSLKTIMAYTTLDEYVRARDIYHEVMTYGKELPFVISTIYKARIIEGKQQERAKRKFVGGGAAA